jgi:small-conductance mechanosensitive channel
MNRWSSLYANLQAYVPVLAVIATVLVILWSANWLLLRRRPGMGAEARLPRQIMMLVLATAGLLLILLVVPISEVTRGQLLSLVGIVLTGIIALSSTSFVANIMAGLMLRVIGSFKPGDFIRIADQFGRVTERGLMHVEIQTEDRDLTTLPNLHLIKNPVTVVPSSGTIVSATLSLGYDIAHSRVEEVLKKAALKTELQNPFVQIKELGDFAISYRIAAFLPDVKHLLTARSDLRKQVVDMLHADGIEIVSPNFMNQRVLPEHLKMIPRAGEVQAVKTEAATDKNPEEMIFDKADEAEALDLLQEEYTKKKQYLEKLEKDKKSAPENEQPQLETKIQVVKKRLVRLEQQLADARNKSKS